MAGRRRSERSWFWKLGMLVLIAVPGFLLGLVARVAWDEPSLLGSHLLGGTTEVAAWSGTSADEASAAGEAGALPPVAAAAPESPRVPPSILPARPQPVRAPPPAPAAPEPVPAAPVAAAPAAKPPDLTRTQPAAVSPTRPTSTAGRFAVQVGAFGEADSAERLAALLRGKGFDVYVSPGVAAGQARWRVRVGPSPTREAAEEAASRLKAEEQLPTWVLDENGPL